ncbi:MAG TPA: hypothetical protein VI136_20520 [Verrucomicrobiae bacterium]
MALVASNSTIIQSVAKTPFAPATLQTPGNTTLGADRSRKTPEKPVDLDLLSDSFCGPCIGKRLNENVFAQSQFGRPQMACD